MSVQTSVAGPRHADLWGLCPQCHRWFDCSDWAELSAPPCPDCATPAQQVVRLRSPADARPARSAVPEVWIG